jgi:hypothetical protein
VNNIITRNALHDARITFLASQPWTHALTLVYNDWPISDQRIRHDLRGLYARIDRALFGTRFHRLKLEQRSRFVAVAEGRSHHPHVHSMWEIKSARRSAEFMGMFHAGLWSRFAPAGSFELVPITDVKGWVAYSLKDFHERDEWISSDEFLPVEALGRSPGLTAGDAEL